MTGTKDDSEDRTWMELQSADLGIRIEIPPFPPPVLHYDDERREHFLIASRDDLQEFVAITRRVACAGGETVAAWWAEADRFRNRPDWTDAVVGGPFAASVDGARGHQGWLRLRDARAQEYLGLLWVGRVGDDCVTVAYHCHIDRAPFFVQRYRRICDSIRWTRE